MLLPLLLVRVLRSCRVLRHLPCRVRMPFFLTLVRAYSDHAESFEEFNERFVKFFDGVEDQFEAQRGLNNAFAHDLVPSPEVIESALRAARRVNDFSLAVRIFEGLKFKVENDSQYKQYLDALSSVREELNVPLKEEIYSS